jgi:endonuclease YncB( thermonuclease family)
MKAILKSLAKVIGGDTVDVNGIRIGMQPINTAEQGNRSRGIKRFPAKHVMQ